MLPVGQCQAVKAFHSIGHCSASKGGVVLGSVGHFLEESSKWFYLAGTGEPMPGPVGLAINFLVC